MKRRSFIKRVLIFLAALAFAPKSAIPKEKKYIKEIDVHKVVGFKFEWPENDDPLFSNPSPGDDWEIVEQPHGYFLFEGDWLDNRRANLFIAQPLGKSEPRKVICLQNPARGTLKDTRSNFEFIDWDYSKYDLSVGKFYV